MVEGKGIFSESDFIANPKDPNQNPWYILMTLHGEQMGETIDWELHEKNRTSWNDINSNIVPDSASVKFSAVGLNMLDREGGQDK
ncbi:hypothetical protein [Yoonia maritima]|uniref:hypothetical protein n=1 Tax=Yoonia maritima TaxID=1435347 RepID=UPI000D1061CE|nr:hypothetical protein [Yoonia maritima]